MSATADIDRWRAAVVSAWALAAVTATLAYAPIGWQQAFESQVTVWVPIMAAYAAARLISRARHRGDLVGGGIALLAWLVIMISSRTPNLLATMGSAAPLLAGLSFALWQRLRDACRDRLAQLAREREMAERERIAAERSRMAADLHDRATHEIDRVVFQARQLGGGDNGPDMQRVADEIASTATGALSQMREFSRSVRNDAERLAATTDHTAIHVAEELADLVAAHRELGQRVLLHRDSAPELPRAGPVARCILRAAQEGLVNAVKHSRDTDADADADSEVVVTWSTSENSEELRMVNALPTRADESGLTATGSGTGLRGMASRVKLLGGTMDCGECDGEFRLRVSFPAAEPATAKQQDSPAATSGKGPAA